MRKKEDKVDNKTGINKRNEKKASEKERSKSKFLAYAHVQKKIITMIITIIILLLILRKLHLHMIKCTSHIKAYLTKNFKGRLFKRNLT